MKLSWVEIKNFRSLADVRLDFRAHRALALVGVNESGKSNLLRALALLGTEKVSRASDVRVQRPDEPQITQAHVEFRFDLSKSELDDLLKKMGKLALAKGGALPKFQGKYGERSFRQFAMSRSGATLSIDLFEGFTGIWTGELDDEFSEVEDGWLQLQNRTDTVVVADWHSPSNVSLAGKALIYPEDIAGLSTIPGAIPLTATALDRIWNDLVAAHIEKRLPKVLLWTFEKENLLPDAVPLDEFATNPSICRPLESMFFLAGLEKIGEEINRERALGRQRLNNLLNRVASRTSAHLQSVWKDYKPASIELQLDGSDIRISVKDESLSFGFADRSDGFKRFVTFLLLISGKAKNDELENALLLIDEPEVSLHPAGVRNLRDELLRIAQKNIVVYATHSPQMIDARTVGRHVIVRKLAEVTRCEIAKAGRFFDEEVLLNSLGTSVFDSLKPVNVLFEGWRDMRLFQVYHGARDNNPGFANCGIGFVQGVKDFKNIVPIIALAERRVLIVSDHDKPALEARKAFIDARLGDGWVTYKELEGDASIAVTAEDFVKAEALKTAFDKLCSNHNVEAKLGIADVSGASRLDAMKGKLAAAGVSGDNLKQLLDELKSMIFEALEVGHIEQNYSTVTTALETAVIGHANRETPKKTHLTVATSG